MYMYCENLLNESSFIAVSDKYVVTPTGELHVTNVEASDSNSIYKCKTTQKLSNESSVSKIGGRLYITGMQLIF